MVVAQALLGAPTSQLLGLPRPNTPAHCPRGPPRHPGICRQRRWRGGAAGPTPLAALFAGTSGAAASGDDVGGGGGGERVWTASGYLSGSESDGGELSWAEVERRLAVALNLIATSELLVPYDRSAVNLGLIVWWVHRGPIVWSGLPLALFVLLVVCSGPTCGGWGQRQGQPWALRSVNSWPQGLGGYRPLCCGCCCCCCCWGSLLLYVSL